MLVLARRVNEQLVINGEIPYILGDADKFDQILTNLISNAIKYSPSGGEVRVEVSNNDSSDDAITIAVRDQGIGIPADKVSRIFEKFERVDDRDTRSAGGTGIGLFLVKHLVERHEGRVWVESEVGKGSSFMVQLPMHPLQADEELRHLDHSGGRREAQMRRL